MVAGYNRELGQHATIPGSRAVSRSYIQIQIVGDIKAIACGTDKVAGAAGETAGYMFFPHGTLIFASDNLRDFRNFGLKRAAERLRQ